MFAAFAFIVCVAIICMTVVVAVTAPLAYNYMTEKRDYPLGVRITRLEHKVNRLDSKVK